jgi:hypothetical protein
VKLPKPVGRLREGDVGLSIVLGLQIVTLFVAAPLAATGVLPAGAVDTLRLGLAAAAVLLLTRTLLSAGAVILAFILSAGLGFAVRAGGGATVITLERLAAGGAFDVAILVVVARSVFGGGRVSTHKVLGAVIVYLSVGLIFANVFRACALLLHPSFSVLPPGRGALSQLLYFSLSTLTTTGFGDIAPVHPFVRSLANLEAVIGQLYPATLLARLVTLQASAADVDRTRP